MSKTWAQAFEPIIPFMDNGKRMGFEKFCKEIYMPTFYRILQSEEIFKNEIMK